MNLCVRVFFRNRRASKIAHQNIFDSFCLFVEEGDGDEPDGYIDVVGIVRRKYLFNTMPQPIVGAH